MYLCAKTASKMIVPPKNRRCGTFLVNYDIINRKLKPTKTFSIVQKQKNESKIVQWRLLSTKKFKKYRFAQLQDIKYTSLVSKTVSGTPNNTYLNNFNIFQKGLKKILWQKNFTSLYYLHWYFLMFLSRSYYQSSIFGSFFNMYFMYFSKISSLSYYLIEK